MKKYQSYIVLLILAGFTYLLSCGDDNNNKAASAPTGKTEQASSTARTKGMKDADAVPTDMDNANTVNQDPIFDNEMRTKAFTGLLQGKWINEGDPGQTMQFTGNKVQYMNNGQPVAETSFIIDYSCENSQCLENGKTPVGWCLVETSSSGEKCKVVTRIDQQFFVFKDMTTGGKVQYKKDAKSK